MDKKNIIPQQAQPVVRVTPGTHADLLAELSEENLGAVGVVASFDTGWRVGNEGGQACWSPIPWVCSYDGDDAE